VVFLGFRAPGRAGLTGTLGAIFSVTGKTEVLFGIPDNFHKIGFGSSDSARFGRMPTQMPEPCKKFSKRMPLNEKFLKHLPSCPNCRAVLAYLRWDATMRVWIHRHRN
jgi:hypothetical protein